MRSHMARSTLRSAGPPEVTNPAMPHIESLHFSKRLRTDRTCLWHGRTNPAPAGSLAILLRACSCRLKARKRTVHQDISCARDAEPPRTNLESNVRTAARPDGGLP